MKPQRAVVLVLAGLAVLFLAWLLLAPQFRPAPTLSGYIEGETLYLSAAVPGTVTRLGVRRGQRVDGGARLFQVEPDQQAAQADQATAELAAARAQAEDARRGQRPPEIAVLEADRNAAEASVRETRIALNRAQELVRRGIYARVRLDEARAAYQNAAAQLDAARQRIEVAELGQREDQIRAADARVAQAQGRVTETSARLATLSPIAPSAGRIEDVFFQRGEWVAANQAVIALIPDDRVFVRFFVPETEVAAYRPGRQVHFSCDGCATNLAATISYVSPRPEFTPPVIYSREARDRLVFMVEARPANGAALIPGLPVDVERVE
ncbi:HlyD family efflux transporter periplasmic adaptor subunit [Sphingosinicella sp. LHD-64]|uniref:HlyD family secretion protein n=1 Tax=Sphingosinicella sp. LHD-64 TaxID=3072139 RepID=UPI00280EB26E|nr:HlyD family efflux transporter periplasmic adaptor subunit [Sphingosinicella sp. LHD-64]MDQ8755617.1 HlyD family efflux transporter periplasmic adaptor subunit [Sphingosinicella sp. LHD-64]